MISMTSTPLKSKGGIGFKNAHASASKIISLSTPITKVCQKSSLKTNGPKKSNDARLTNLELKAQEDLSLGNPSMLILMVFIVLK